MTSASESVAAVIDTNLIVSALITRRGTPFRLIQAIYRLAFTLIVAPAVLQEYQRVLIRPHLVETYGINPDDVAAFLRFAQSRARIVVPSDPDDVPLPVRDPKDAQLIAAALAGSADYLVTGDNDLLVLASQSRLGTPQIVTPARFSMIVADL
jgi:putative PIN family toxin of toxin-antitoxin system